MEQHNTFFSRRTRLWLVAGSALAAIAVLGFIPPIPQDLSYHEFADGRSLLGIANFLDVVSNVPFLLVGALGLVFLWRQRQAGAGSAFIEKSEAWPYEVLFLGVALTGLGSAYYHLAPENATLTWDRLPMTLIFAGFLAATLGERIGLKVGLRALPPLVCLGVVSVVYWHWSELRGAGDLRPYALVQYYPVLAIPLLVALFPARYTRSADLLGAAAIYAVAKILESLDAAIFSLGQVVSGHTLKHLAAAVAAYWVLRMLRRREPVEEASACRAG